MPCAALQQWLGQAVPDLRAVEAMAGGAGARRYWRVRAAGREPAVCMEVWPEDPAILPPGLARAHGFPFLEMTRWLAEREFPVPQLLRADPEGRWLLLEDLGSRHLLDVPAHERAPHYRTALELLARLHRLPTDGPADELPYARGFDTPWVLFELRLFAEQVPAGQPASELAEACRALAAHVAALPRRVCLRDFQSHNLMIDARGALRILDYQDALLAPPELDLAALLHDSYVELGAAQRAELLAHYERARGERVAPAALAALVVQRKCKDLSRYRRLVARGDLRYRGADARAVDSILGALPELAPELGSARRTLEAAVRASAAA